MISALLSYLKIDSPVELYTGRFKWIQGSLILSTKILDYSWSTYREVWLHICELYREYFDFCQTAYMVTWLYLYCLLDIWLKLNCLLGYLNAAKLLVELHTGWLDCIWTDVIGSNWSVYRMILLYLDCILSDLTPLCSAEAYFVVKIKLTGHIN